MDRAGPAGPAVIVVDTNVLLYLTVLTDETPLARRIRARDEDWRVPTWWRAEYVNALVLGIRHARYGPGAAWQAWETACDLVRRRQMHTDERLVLTTALRDGISAYDAQFVALADRLGVPLVTADRGLVRARPDRAVLLGDFAG